MTIPTVSRSNSRSSLAIAAFVALTATISTSTAFAAEHKVDRAQLPPAVAATIDRETQGATIKGYSTERENGKKVYEAETLFNGHTRDIQIAEDGTLNEVEEEVALDALPDKVKSALAAKASGAKITKVESLTKGGKLVAYEAATLKAGKKGEVQVGPEGGTLSHEE